jgi:hypothetical protein
MTIKGHTFGPHIDPRFTLHQQQPRADKLGIAQRRLCRMDHVFADALRKRVANPIRWDAFLAGKPDYQGHACPKCGSTRRRTRDRSCYLCKLQANAENFGRIRIGIAHVANRTRAGYFDLLARRKQERSGDCATFSADRFAARQYPTGRLEVRAPDVHIAIHRTLASCRGRLSSACAIAIQSCAMCFGGPAGRCQHNRRYDRFPAAAGLPMYMGGNKSLTSLLLDHYIAECQWLSGNPGSTDAAAPLNE